MRMLALLALVGYAIYFAGLIALHFLPTGRRLLYHTVSDYSRGRFSGLARAMTATNSVATLLLLAALATGPLASRLSTGGVEALATLALTRLGMVFFITDESGTRASASGLVHALLAVLSFAAAISAATTITPELPFTATGSFLPLLSPLARLAFPLVVVLALCLLPRLRPVFGLAERLFLADVNLWLLVLAAGLTLH